MKRHMKRIFKRVVSGVYVKSDSEQLCLEIKNLEARIALQLAIEDQSYTIHVYEKTLDEYAATVCTMQKRIEKLEGTQKRLTAQLKYQHKRYRVLAALRR